MRVAVVAGDVELMGLLLGRGHQSRGDRHVGIIGRRGMVGKFFRDAAAVGDSMERRGSVASIMSSARLSDNDR